MVRTRSRFIGVAALLASSSAIFAVAAPASGDDGRHPVRFETFSPITAATLAIALPADVHRCSITPPFVLAAPCVMPIDPQPGFDNVFTGDFTGVERSAESFVSTVFVASDPIDLPFVRYDRFEGSVAGCGTGSFLARTDGNLDNLAPDRWEIVAHSGRGDLTGISGSGTFVDAADGPGGQLHGVGTGRVRCGKHGHDG